VANSSWIIVTASAPAKASSRPRQRRDAIPIATSGTSRLNVPAVVSSRRRPA